MDYTPITVGEAFPGDLLDLPGLTWDPPGFLVMVVPSDDVALRVALTGDNLSLGVASAGPVPVLMLRVRDHDGGTVLGHWEAPSAWREGNPPPEVRVEEADRILWQFVVVEGGPGYTRTSRGLPRELPVVSLRAFTTSPALTRVLRRLRSEQRAAGPMTDAEVSAAIDEHYARVPSGADAWRRCLITSRVGQ